METKFYIVNALEEDGVFRFPRTFTEDADTALSGALESLKLIPKRILRRERDDRPVTVYAVTIEGETAQELGLNAALFARYWPSTACMTYGKYPIAEEIQAQVDEKWLKKRGQLGDM